MSRLLGYLMGQVPPPDLEYYIETFPHLCPLCLNENHGYTIHTFKIIEDVETTKVQGCICAECHGEIEDAEVFEEHKYWEENTPTKALEEYIEMHKFPPKAQAFTRIPHLCVFCRSDIGDDYMELELPTGDETLGGIVNACGSCATILKWAKKYAAIDSCVVCERNYPITASEYRLRSDDFMLGKHFCFTCAISQHGDISLEERWQTAACEICGGSVVQDLTCNTKKQLNVPRCQEHVSYVSAKDLAEGEHNLFIHYTKKYPLLRAVIMDTSTHTKISYETVVPDNDKYYKVLDYEIILAATVKPEDILWQAATKLENIGKDSTHENKR